MNAEKDIVPNVGPATDNAATPKSAAPWPAWLQPEWPESWATVTRRIEWWTAVREFHDSRSDGRETQQLHEDEAWRAERMITALERNRVRRFVAS